MIANFWLLVNSEIYLADSGDNIIRLWSLEDIDTQKISFFIGHKDLVRSISASNTGVLVSGIGYCDLGSSDYSIRLWNFTGTFQISDIVGHKEPVWAIAISLDGDLLATGNRLKIEKVQGTD